MITHFADTRGHADHGWLKSKHTFSFANYYDPTRMGFGKLRVINDDFIAPGMGFGTHPHRDMEIISIPLGGALAHKDSVGNAYTIRKGEVQVMSAGTGIAHSEFNASDKEEAQLLQIWVLPKLMKVPPRYEQKAFNLEDRKNKFNLVVSPDGREGSCAINQDAFFSLTEMDEGVELQYDKKLNSNGMYAFVISGSVEIDGHEFHARDGVGIESFEKLKLKATSQAEVLLMEIPL